MKRTTTSATAMLYLTLLLTLPTCAAVSSNRPPHAEPSGRQTETIAPLTVPTMHRRTQAVITAPPASRAYSVTDIGKAGVPTLSASQIRLIHRVRAATSPAFRNGLMFAIEVRSSNLMLFYGGPQMKGSPIPFRVFGTCNVFYTQGTFVAAPGDAMRCETWKPTRADLLILDSRTDSNAR